MPKVKAFKPDNLISGQSEKETNSPFKMNLIKQG